MKPSRNGTIHVKLTYCKRRTKAYYKINYHDILFAAARLPRSWSVVRLAICGILNWGLREILDVATALFEVRRRTVAICFSHRWPSLETKWSNFVIWSSFRKSFLSSSSSSSSNLFTAYSSIYFYFFRYILIPSTNPRGTFSRYIVGTWSLNWNCNNAKWHSLLHPRKR